MNDRLRFLLLRWFLASVAGLLVMAAAFVTGRAAFRLLMAIPHWVRPYFVPACLIISSLAAAIAGWRRATRDRRKASTDHRASALS